jgi:hypothetical protein
MKRWFIYYIVPSIWDKKKSFKIVREIVEVQKINATFNQVLIPLWSKLQIYIVTWHVLQIIQVCITETPHRPKRWGGQ